MPYVGRTPSAVPVTADDIPANSIDASKIVDGSIELAEIADNSITDAKLNSSKLDGIEAGATNYIHPTTHATADIADNAITDAKLNSAKLNGIEAGATADQSKTDIEGLGIAASSITGALPAISGSALTGVGKVLQVKSFSTDSSTSTTSTSFVPTMLTLSITPTSASSKILILWDATGYRSGSATDGIGVIIDRDGSLINGLTSRHNMATYMGGASEVHAKISQHYLDTPNTITATTYTVKVKSYGGSTVDFGNGVYSQSTITLMEIGA